MRKYSREMLKREFNITDDNICIDLGCGSRKQKGYIGIDCQQLEGVDIVCDIEKGLPFEDNTIDIRKCSIRARKQLYSFYEGALSYLPQWGNYQGKFPLLGICNTRERPDSQTGHNYRDY